MAALNIRQGLAALMMLVALVATGTAMAQDRAQLIVTDEAGYGRLVFTFPDRDSDLPPYEIESENGVLAVDFPGGVDLLLPDLSGALTDYVAIARVDDDGAGVRFGLRAAYNFNRIEAGHQLFIDLLPADWRGPPPQLPAAVLRQMAERAEAAARRIEEERVAEEARRIGPAVAVRVGQNPTFTRYQFTWNVDTEARFEQQGQTGALHFGWPVAIDLYGIRAQLPASVLGVDNTVTGTGSDMTLALAEGVVPRFFQISPREFIVDIDTIGEEPATVDLAALIAQQSAKAEAEAEQQAEAADDAGHADLGENSQLSITPVIGRIGSTIRVTFPFDRDTPAAVFRRGNTVWMMFDTSTAVLSPEGLGDLTEAASDFSAAPSGNTQVVRLTLSGDRLATLGSEGRAWVLSLGDVLLAPTAPLDLVRRSDAEGQFEVTGDLIRPSRVHRFTDPLVGDTLDVVTAYPPALGVARTLEFVDFSALRSVHGLVIKPQSTGVSVALEDTLAIVRSPFGLTLSSADESRQAALFGEPETRESYLELGGMLAADPNDLIERQDSLTSAAAAANADLIPPARLDLARFYLANQMGQEALGVLRVMLEGLSPDRITTRMIVAGAAANVLSARPLDALAVLNGEAVAGEIDALVWRTLARNETLDYRGARNDAVSAEPVIAAYPDWLQQRFFLAATEAAIETGEIPLATRFLNRLTFAMLDAEQRSRHLLLSGRIDEAEGRLDEALDTYGQVITADIRPTRAEAVYRTLVVLDSRGTIDAAAAARTLSAESMMWRNNPLEARMLHLLSDLYFRAGDYRGGLETAKGAMGFYRDSAPIRELENEAQDVFVALFLDGEADRLGAVEALSLYYDFRQLTPAGARGDEMIRNLVRRLVQVDLLTQAADLLTYQIDNRLTGSAQAQIAADLAIIEIANRRPEVALNVLNRTRMSDLPPSLERQRRILEARALIDANRDALALDLMSAMSGRDVELLRVDAHWHGRRYAEAARVLETMYEPVDPAGPPSTATRMGIIKAAVGYVLGNDAQGISRLRQKFSERMQTTPEWPLFDLVTGPMDAGTVEFRRVAAQVAGVDGINAFLAAYRDLYGPDGALAPVSAMPEAGRAVAAL